VINEVCVYIYNQLTLRSELTLHVLWIPFAQTVFESSMTALFFDESAPKYEMSDIIVKGDKFYAVADSSWNIFEVDRTLPHFSSANREIVPAQDRGDEKSSFEGIFEDNG
jgi:hypothetical protein